MRTFPAAFSAALAKNSGTPLWIFSLTAGGVTYYLSDQGRTIPTWQGGVIVRPWVTSWGQITEALGLGLAEIRVSDFSASFRIDPMAAPNMEDLAAADDIEASAVTLWLWFVGLDPATAPPQALWSGFVDAVDLPDDSMVTMTFEDGSSRLRSDLGAIITTAAYPTADPDDVGKILPIVYGVVKKLPPVATEAGRLTTLTVELSDSATSAVVLEVTGLAINDYCDINFETVKITAINPGTRTLTIARAQLGTEAALHLVGATVRQQKSLYKLIAHDGPLTSIDRVLLRVDTDIDITSLVTRYTGAAGNIYTAAGYTGKAVITLTPAQITSIRTLVENLSALYDPTHGHGAALTTKALVPDFLSVISGLWYNQSVPANPQYDAYNSVDNKPSTYATADSGSGVTCDFSLSKPTGSTGTPKRVRIGAIAPLGTITGRTATISLRDGAITLVSASLPHNTIAYSDWVTLATQTWATVQAYKIRYVGGGSGQYSQLGEIWMEVEFDPSSGNASTGITINTSLESAIGGQILVDVTAPQSACLDVVNNLLARAGLLANATLTGAFPAGYAINGAITTPRPIIDIINQIAFESRAWFRFMAGIPRLIVRPDTLSSARTLTACAVDNNLMRRYSRKKTPVDDLLNTITLRYGRDYTIAPGADAYTLTSSATNSASVTTHGTRQDDDLFRCDFITTAAMADSVRDYYLTRYANRRWQHRFRIFLDQLPVEFADAITLAFAGNAVGEVMESRLTPGQGGEIDSIELMVVAPPVDRIAPVVTVFTGPASSEPLTISGLTLSAIDNTAVTGYLITTTPVPPWPTATGWSSVAPTTHTVSNGGEVTLYAWAKDAADNVSAVYSPLVVTVYNASPIFTAQPTAASVTTTTVTLAFATSDAEGDHYLLAGSSGNSAIWATLAADETPGSGKTVTFSGLSFNTLYSLRLRLTPLTGNTTPVLSDVVVVSTLDDPSAPDKYITDSAGAFILTTAAGTIALTTRR